jgi:hypothetical protein
LTEAPKDNYSKILARMNEYPRPEAELCKHGRVEKSLSRTLRQRRLRRSRRRCNEGEG